MYDICVRYLDIDHEVQYVFDENIFEFLQIMIYDSIFNSMSLIQFLSFITRFYKLNQLSLFEVGYLLFAGDTQSVYILHSYELILKIYEIC